MAHPNLSRYEYQLANPGTNFSSSLGSDGEHGHVGTNFSIDGTRTMVQIPLERVSYDSLVEPHPFVRHKFKTLSQGGVSNGSLQVINHESSNFWSKQSTVSNMSNEGGSIYIEKIKAAQETRTTLMVKNVPCRY